MKTNYSKMTKAELIKRIEELELSNGTGKIKTSDSAKKELLNELQEKDIQLEAKKKELNQKQHQLEEAHDKFLEFYDYTPTGCITVDDQGIIQEINLTAMDMIGIEKKTEAKNSFFHSLASGDMLKFIQLLKNCRMAYEQFSEEFIIQKNKGENLNVYLTAVPFHDYKKNKTFFRIFFSDITQQKKSETKIRESEKRFRLMADAASVMIWMTDVNNRLEYMNKTRLDFLGKSLSELSKDGWIQSIHPEDRENFLKEFSNAAKDKKAFSLEMRVKNKDGDYQWILETASPRFLEDEKFAGFIGSGVNITENKNFRNNLQKSLKEKEILMREIHHRVKNNLQVISSLLNLQSSYIKDQEALTIFKSSRDRVRSMALLHEKLYQSKNITQIDLNNYINDLVTNLFDSYKPSADLHFNLDVEDIHLDIGVSISLGLILTELVSNSLKHAFTGKLKGEINIVLSLPKDHQLKLLVNDNGKGLPQDFDIKHSPSFGLDLVNAIVDQHQGSLEVNKNGKTEFKIYLKC
jgi:PAS domain S-box-containing protein